MTAIAVSTSQSSSYKWYILGLGALTFTFVVAIPAMSLPVLFDEISQELGLTLVQVGWIWGVGAMMGIVMGLLGGPLGDRWGARRTLVGACLIVSIVGVLRGLVWDFWSMAAAMFALGFGASAIPINVHKTCGVWFAGPRLGMANSVASVGMALGFMLGSLLAATVLSPLLGGWRHVFYLYGAIALVFSLLWWMSQEKATEPGAEQTQRPTLSIRAAVGHVARIRNVWLYSLATLGVSACIAGALGYLPLYLRQLGWPNAAADSALAAFHAVSMICAIPLALLSDRLGTRRRVLMVAALLVTIGVGMLSFVQGGWILFAVVIAGMTRDGFMALTMTATMEVRGVGALYAGSATGLLMAWSGLGNVIAPPLGNSLAAISLSAPFVLWAAMAAVGFGVYFAIREDG